MSRSFRKTDRRFGDDFDPFLARKAETERRNRRRLHRDQEESEHWPEGWR